MKIKERSEKYINSSNYFLMPKVPVGFILKINNFSKLDLKKPFDKKFSDAIICTMLKLCKEIEGCVFGYNFLDEIFIISRNDQTMETMPWYDNNLQKLASVTSSIASVEFNKIYNDEIYFNSHVFLLPTMVECTNFIASKQHQNSQRLLNSLVMDNLFLSFDEALALSIEDKIQILKDESINYTSLSPVLRKGCAVYRKLEEDRYRWFLDQDVPVFLHNKDFLYSIFLNS